MPSVTGAKDRAIRRRTGGGAARSFAPVVVAFVAIAAGFLGSTIYGEVRASQIDREALLIETNSLPSVELIVAAQSALRRLDVATEEYAHGTAAERVDAARAVEAERREIDREVSAEAQTGMYPGELQLTGALGSALGELDALLAQMLTVGATDPAGARALSERDVRSAIEQTGAALDRLLSLNAAEAHTEARRIADLRATAVRLAFGLDALCLVFSVAAALVALQALAKRQATERAHEALLETRAAELEVFARRVAHDLLSPLAALSFTLATVKRNGERGLPIGEPLERSVACLKRSQRLVDAVLDFARSAASPSPGERASLRDAIAGVLDEVRSDEAGARDVTLLSAALDEDVVVPCAPGILASVLSNLVKNAVKYIDAGERDEDAPEKRVTIRVLPSASEVRVEIEDTGPGLPPELASQVFEPYFRAPNNSKPGLGLGLATVRRFVEAHRGSVGVEQAPGRGSIFWFRLPRVPAPAGALEPAIRIGNGVTGR